MYGAPDNPEDTKNYYGHVLHPYYIAASHEIRQIIGTNPLRAENKPDYFDYITGFSILHNFSLSTIGNRIRNSVPTLGSL